MMDVLAPELLSQFIAAIYDCIIEPDGWSAQRPLDTGPTVIGQVAP
jgi:hypothetical protein